jgi:hypothetical protein
MITAVVDFHCLLPRPETYSLHIPVRAFAMFSDEAVDPRRDNGQRYGAELRARAIAACRRRQGFGVPRIR